MKNLQTFEEFLNESSNAQVSQLIKSFPDAKVKWFTNYSGEEIDLREIFTKTAKEPRIIFGVAKKKGRIIPVELDDLIPMQSNVSKEVLLQKLNASSNELPIVGSYEGKFYIVSGHHRLALEKLKGNKKTLVRLVNI